MSGFPIANALKNGVGLQPPSSGIGLDVVKDFDIKGTLSEAAYFDFSLPSRLYWEGKQDYYELEADFGPLRSPYSTVWAEWSVPRRIVIEGTETDMHPICGQRVAALIIEDDFDTSDIDVSKVMEAPSPRVLSDTPDEMQRAHKLFERLPKTVKRQALEALQRSRLKTIRSSATLFLLRDDGVPIMFPYIKTIQLDPKTGRYLHGSAADMSSTDYNGDQATLFRHRTIVGMHLNAAWMGLTLINCRNVTTREQGVVFGRSGKEKRLGVPLVRYHTIVLPGEASRASNPARRRAEADHTMALHRVRGHFKTFTAEAPLMGKHVGTYWWGWQVRGNKENGIVVSDYKVGVPV